MNPSYYKKPGLWLLFALYLTLIAFSQSLHESWGDELQTWDLIKGSNSFFELLSNCCYDGHPPLWYILLYILSQLTHSLWLIKLFSFLTTGLLGFLLIFYSKFSWGMKALSLSGYYFLYEYALFSRNYAIAILIAFALCVVINREFKYKQGVFYVLLFLLANSHLLGLFLAISFQLFFLMKEREKKIHLKTYFFHCTIGALILFSGLYFIFSSYNISTSTGDVLRAWNRGQVSVALQVPLRSFVNLPAWWEYHFWNTNAIWALANGSVMAKIIALGISLAALVVTTFTLLNNRKVLFFFSINTILTLGFALVFPLVNARYVGFLYIGFLLSLWLNGNEQDLDKPRRYLIYFILILQVPGSVIALSKEWMYPFSQIKEVKNILSLIPEGRDLITDYWGLNYLSAVTDKSYYCVENRKIQSFLLLNKEWTNSLSNKSRYTDGTEYFLRQRNLNGVFLLCNTAPSELNVIDKQLNRKFKMTLISAKIGSIDKFSDLYLYNIQLRH